MAPIPTRMIFGNTILSTTAGCRRQICLVPALKHTVSTERSTGVSIMDSSWQEGPEGASYTIPRRTYGEHCRTCLADPGIILPPIWLAVAFISQEGPGA